VANGSIPAQTFRRTDKQGGGSGPDDRPDGPARFEDHECLPSVPNPLFSSQSPTTESSCTTWWFLDANTGEMLEARQQLG
jgi:hypothetical protein